MTNNWNALAFALSMPYNNLLMDNLKMEADKGEEFVTVTFFPDDEDYVLNFSGVYSSNESDSHYVGHRSFETKELRLFIESIKVKVNEKLCLALLSYPPAMAEATKLSHDSKSKQFLGFCFTSGDIVLKNEYCSITEFRAWRRLFFYTRWEFLQDCNKYFSQKTFHKTN